MSRSSLSRRVGGLGVLGWCVALCALLAPSLAIAQSAAADRPWMNTSLSPDERANLLLAQMTLEEKVDLMSGNQGEGPYAFYNAPIPRLGIPAMAMADSASGIHAHGSPSTNTGDLATAMPSAQALGATWSLDAITPYAAQVAKEARATTHNELLSPVGDILRNPFWGRTNESPSEDPIMTANYLSKFTKVVQDADVVATLKHYLAYNQETNRSSGGNNIVSTRALREVYALPYEAAVAESDPGSVMCAFNKINGGYACENPTTGRELLDTIGFTGFMGTDYGAAHTTLGSLAGGVDMETGNKDAYSGHLLDAVRNGTVPESRLDVSCRRILYTMFRLRVFDNPVTRGPIDVAAGNKIARETQEKAITLLKNSGKTLPLTRKAKKITVIGADANHNAIGGGTPFVLAAKKTTSLQGIVDRASDAGASVNWVQGNDPANGANMLEAADMTAVPSSVLSPNNGVGSGLNAWFWKDNNFQGSPDEQRIARQVIYDVGILSTLDTPGPSQVPPPPVNCATCPGSAVYEGHITAPKTGAYTLALTGLGDATLDIDGQRVATMQGATRHLAHAETPTLNWVEGQTHTLRITFKGNAPFEILNDGSVLLEWKTPADAYSPTLKKAVAAAQKSDVAIVYATTIEGEAHDRLSLKLPQGADQMIEAVAEANPNTIVVLANAGPVTMPWLNKVDAVVETYYGGQAQGAALARVLWGDVNPSGKLTMTYPTSEEDLPPGVESPYAGAEDVDVVYGEGVSVGYKGYEAAGITPLFPFGFGLSYSKFKYSDLTVTGTNPATSPTRVRFTITNTGKLDGDEVAQVYLRLPSSTGEQKRLVGYSRVSTKAGQSTMVDVTIDPKAATHPLGYFDTTSDSWTIAPGTYKVEVGASSRTTPLKATFTVG
jgi:beta-glucosidase